MGRKSKYAALTGILTAVLILTGCGSTETALAAQTATAGEQEASASGSGLSAAGGVTENTAAQAESSTAAGGRETIREFPEIDSEITVTDGNALGAFDLSHADEGYILASYSGDADLAKLQITAPDGETAYTYNLPEEGYMVYPLSCGDGTYHAAIYEHVEDSSYALVYAADLEVSLTDEMAPFLIPNQYAWYDADSEAVALGMTLSDASADDLGYLEKVYNYVIENITYDTAKAEDPPAGYIPDADATLSEGTGICFDYASLMTVMLRSQGIPTRLMVGYSGTAYHAWISVWLDEVGWVDDIIEFDGKSWSLMDPTLAANNSKNAVKKYIGDGSNYQVKYIY